MLFIYSISCSKKEGNFYVYSMFLGLVRVLLFLCHLRMMHNSGCVNFICANC